MERIAIVTGGGSGIGAATALALAETGWKVVVAGRRLAALEGVCAQNDGALVAKQTDVTDEASVEALFDFAIEKFGRLDLLFNNAGAGSGGKFQDVTLEALNAAVAVNINGTFLCARAAFRQMIKQSPQGGRIINNGSVSAYVPRPFMAPYTISKHAITGLTKTLSLEGRPYNIACGQIDVGNAASELVAQITKGLPQADGRMIEEPTMDVVNVAKSVVHMAGLPMEANVQFMTVLATNMPYIGRG